MICLSLAALPTAALAGYLGWCWAKGQPPAMIRTLADGVEYERRIIESPQPAVVHLVRIDLTAGHQLVVSPADVATPKGLRCAATTTTDALEQLDADLTINASFFRPFRDQWFLDYYPHHHDPVEAVGTTISHGVRYGRDAPDWPSLCVQDDGAVYLGIPDSQTKQAVSGDRWLLRGGQPAATRAADDVPYARTVVGLDQERNTLWLVVVDGKQPRYSEGTTISQLATLLQSLGVTDAINLDGGGSSTLAVREESGPRLLNRPCHTKIPGRQRPVANHLGVVFRDTP